MQKEFDAELFEVMSNAMAPIQDYLEPYRDGNNHILRLKLILIGMISSVVEIEEIRNRGSAAYLWSEIEAAAKQSGLAGIAKKLEESGSEYSVSEIKANDFAGGMNYLGQKMAEVMFKHIHDLPESIRKPEMFLRAIEVLLANLLNDTFRDEDAAGILDSLCEHVQMALDDLALHKH